MEVAVGSVVTLRVLQTHPWAGCRIGNARMGWGARVCSHLANRVRVLTRILVVSELGVLVSGLTAVLTGVAHVVAAGRGGQVVVGAVWVLVRMVLLLLVVLVVVGVLVKRLVCVVAGGVV